MSQAKHINDLIANRRALLGGLAGLPLLNLAACATASAPAASAPPTATATGFASVAATQADTITLPPGYRWQTLVAWGDALFDSVSPSFNPDALTRAEQEQRFGQNNDMLALFPAEYAFPLPKDQNRFLLCANHEYVEPSLLFPALHSLREFTPTHAEAALAAVGVSVVEVERSGGEWRVHKDSAPGTGRNRRITPFSPVIFSGPAANHRWIEAGKGAFNAASDPAEPGTVHCGTLANCAGGRTPWGTYLTSEENFDGFFMLSNAAAEPLAAAQQDGAWIYDAGRFGYPLFSGSARPYPAQYDVSHNPHGPALYGWVTEIDPYDPTWLPRKRTALGRKKGECATTALTQDGRVVVYMGDDQIDECVYKFVSRGHFDPANRTANRDLLDDGTLYVARFDERGGGAWLPLDLAVINRAIADAPYHQPFENEADVYVRAREAARLLDATPMDRPEDVEALIDENWRGLGTVLVVCTNNKNESFARPGNPRRGEAQREHMQQSNLAGHIIRIDEAGGDCAATHFRWDVFALGGDPARETITSDTGVVRAVSVSLNGQPTISGERFACPDNICFDTRSNVWIATDGSDAVFEDCNDQVIVTPALGEGPRPVKRFLVGPVGAEICGPTLALDETAFLAAIQHPGENDLAGTHISELRWRNGRRPPSNFPDGGETWPRSAVVVVTREDGGRVGD